MILRAVVHKFGALFAAFANVIVAAKVLDDSSALAYLSGLSLVQIAVVFGGFGTTQKLVRSNNDYYNPRSAIPMNVVSGAVAIIVLFVLSTINESSLGKPIWLLNSANLVMLTMAEIVRCATARQDGYVASIISTFLIAALMFVTGTIEFWFAIVPALGCLVTLRFFFTSNRLGQNLITPNVGDMAKAARVAFVHQAYNIIVVLLGIFSSSAAIALMVTLVYRFNIFFNWQAFYWMRFGHKETDVSLPDEHHVRNRKFSYLNLFALFGLLVTTIGVIYLNLDQRFNEQTFNREFLYLVAFYASIRVLFNFTFAYEVYSAYLGSQSQDFKFLLFAFLGLAVISGALMFANNAFVVIVIVEMVWVFWRVSAYKIWSMGRAQ